MPTSTHATAQRPVAPWNVRPHGAIEMLDAGIWSVTGTIHVPIGEFPRRMTIVRLEGGRLLIYSAIALDEATLRQLEGFGTPAFLVVPNDHHREDALAWKQRFAQMEVVAPSGARERIAKQVPVDSVAPDLRDASVTLLTVPGTREHEVALRVRRPGGVTLVVNDIIANVRDPHGLQGWLLKLMKFAGDGPTVPGPIKAMLVKEKAALRQQLLAWAADSELRRIVVSHGEVIEVDPQGALRLLAGTLE